MTSRPLFLELVYISAARAPFSPAALRDLLQKARAKNASLGISGMLLHSEGSFLQVLEGSPDAVNSLYETIAGDERHHRILRVFRTEGDTRSFAEWTMGFAEADASMRAEMKGFNAFLTGAAAPRLDLAIAGKVGDLAHQFRAGRWRQYLGGARRAVG